MQYSEARPMLAAPLLNRQGVAKMLKVSESTVDRLRARGHDPLPALQVGGSVRFDAGAVADWLIRQRKAGVEIAR